jgi:N-acetylmuramoyl-L-alanine amidase
MVKVVVLDPGHGGKDPGAVANGLVEKELTLYLAKRTKQYLDQLYTGHKVVFTRTSDVFVELSRRADISDAAGGDLFCSFHINAGGGTGYEDFRYSGISRNAEQDAIHAEVMKVMAKHGMKDRGKKSANYAVLRETRCSAVLTETLFIDTAKDAGLLKNRSFLDEVSLAHAKGIGNALKLPKKSGGSSTGASYHTIASGDTFWGLAREYSTTVAALQKLNPSVDPAKLSIGSKIRVK